MHVSLHCTELDDLSYFYYACHSVHEPCPSAVRGIVRDAIKGNNRIVHYALVFSQAAFNPTCHSEYSLCLFIIYDSVAIRQHVSHLFLVAVYYSLLAHLLFLKSLAAVSLRCYTYRTVSARFSLLAFFFHVRRSFFFLAVRPGCFFLNSQIPLLLFR